LTVLTQQPPTNGISGYGMTSYTIPPSMQATFEAWLTANFQMVVSTGGLDLTAYRDSGNEWPSYVDGCCIYANEVYQFVLNTAAAQGWPDPEGALLHMNIDYQPSPIYSGIDQFDAYEQQYSSQSQGKPTYAINGVFTLVGATY